MKKNTVTNGERISSEELKKALAEYGIEWKELKIEENSKALEMLKIKSQEMEKEEAQKKTEEVKDKKHHVVKKSKTKVGIGIAATVGMILLSGFSKQPVYENVEETIEDIIQKTNLEYEIIDENKYWDIINEEVQNSGMELNMGDSVTVEDGVSAYTDSKFSGTSKTFGEESFNSEGKYAGEYTVTGFSVVYNDEILDYIENFDNEAIEANLGDFVEQICEEKGISTDDVNVRLHIGANQDHTRAGWVDITDVMDEESLSEKTVEQIADEVTLYKENIEDFEGDTIEITTVSGDLVNIKVKDDNGNYLEEGSTVVGSDGKEYILSSIEEVEEIDMQTTKATYQKEVGKKWAYNIKDCNLCAAILPLLATIASGVSSKKRWTSKLKVMYNKARNKFSASKISEVEERLRQDIKENKEKECDENERN